MNKEIALDMHMRCLVFFILSPHKHFNINILKHVDKRADIRGIFSTLGLLLSGRQIRIMSSGIQPGWITNILREFVEI